MSGLVDGSAIDANQRHIKQKKAPMNFRGWLGRTGMNALAVVDLLLGGVGCTGNAGTDYLRVAVHHLVYPVGHGEVVLGVRNGVERVYGLE